MRNLAVIILMFSFIPYMMAWPQRDMEIDIDTAHPNNTEIKDSYALKCDESNILSCIVAEIDHVERGLVKVTMADHSQIFIPYSSDDPEDYGLEVVSQRNEMKKKEENSIVMNLEIKPDECGNYIDLSAAFYTESHGQVELRSEKYGVVLTLPFYHTVFLDERIITSDLKKGQYDLILRIGSNTWEKQLSL